MKRLRERLEQYGSQTLLTEELLAILLSIGSRSEHMLELGEKLLARYGGLGGLTQADDSELSREYGLGEARIALLKAALEIGKRLHMKQPEERYQITTPSDAAQLVMLDMAYLDYEQLRVIVLDSKNRVVDTVPLYEGTVTRSVLLRAAEVFRLAIIRNCPSIILCHNSPSGKPEPSPVDIEMTSQLVDAGRVLDVELLDYLIIGHHRFVSLKERLRW